MSLFVHPQAICESKNIGESTRVWAFAHILPGAVIGENCNICDHVFIENDVHIGNGVTVKCGVQLWDGLRVGDNVFIAPNVTFTNDIFPRSRKRPPNFLTTTLEDGCSIGANATILPGITVGRNAMVGAGSVVTKNVPPHAIVAGNPARIRNYTSAGSSPLLPVSGPAVSQLSQVEVAGVRLYEIPSFEDIRGKLAAAEIGKSLPFQPVRFFLVYDVPGSEVRGEHAHKTCAQFLLCAKGSVRVLVDDGRLRQEVILSDPTIGLHIAPRVWATQFRYSADAVLLVFASHAYDPDDYIRTYSEWIEWLGSN